VVIEHMPRQYGEGSGGKFGIIWATIVDMLRMWPTLRPKGDPQGGAPPAQALPPDGSR